MGKPGPLMYVVLYLPADNDPETFGPYPTPQRAAQALRRISGAAGRPIDVGDDGALATVDVWIDHERNRYQLLKLGSDDQLDIHADVITEVATTVAVSVETPLPEYLKKGSGLLGG
jgi:hypothetical protein